MSADWQPLIVHLPVDLAIVDHYRPALPDAIADRLARMTSREARARSLSGYWLLEQACRLRGMTGCDLAALTHDKNGRPFLPAGPGFNISHSRGQAGCAIAPEAALGLDVEFERDMRLDRFRRFLSDDEWHACERDPRNFFTAWTAREAAVKATGRVGLSRIARVRVAAGRADLDGDPLYLQHFSAGPGYRICLASRQPLPLAELQTLRFSARPRK